mgnify:CR=1 FL=1|jgi:N-acyl-L-homoserine lactone synthetase
MFYVIDPDNRHLYGAQLEDMHRVRKSVFIDERGWNLKETDGLEIDQYDLPQTEYVLALAEEDRVHGGMRYLPLTGPNMTDDLFAEHLYKPLAPEGAIEATRGFVAKRVRKSVGLWGNKFLLGRNQPLLERHIGQVVEQANTQPFRHVGGTVVINRTLFPFFACGDDHLDLHFRAVKGQRKHRLRVFWG